MHAVRAEVQRSEAPAAELARCDGIDREPLRRWRPCATVEDEPMGQGSLEALSCLAAKG